MEIKLMKKNKWMKRIWNANREKWWNRKLTNIKLKKKYKSKGWNERQTHENKLDENKGINKENDNMKCKKRKIMQEEVNNYKTSKI